MTPRRPNLLFILADQFRADCLGCAGNPLIRTPNLDALAAEGVRFSRCFAQTTPCGPSRMCILTGRYLCSTRTVSNAVPLREPEENLGCYLRAAGYEPAAIGYHDYMELPPPGEGGAAPQPPGNLRFLPGFTPLLDHTYDSPEYFAWLRGLGYPEALLSHQAIHQPDVPSGGPGPHLPLHYPAKYRAEHSESRFVTRKAIEHVTSAGPGWCLSLNYIKPHPPCVAPAPYHNLYDPARMPAPNRRPEELEDQHPYLQLQHSKPRLVEERDWRETRANYYAMITELDACLGELFAVLKSSGQWEQTLIIFSSDHGEYLGDHYFQNKAHFYDETMRIPYLIRDPSPQADATRGRVCDALCESIDSVPTLLEFAGAPVPAHVHGRSLLGLVRTDPRARPKARIFHEYDFRAKAPWVEGAGDHDCLLWVVRDDRFKYVQFGPESMPPLLFDLRSDPGEFHNLAARPGSEGLVAQYAQTLLRWRMRHEDQRLARWAGGAPA